MSPSSSRRLKSPSPEASTWSISDCAVSGMDFGGTLFLGSVAISSHLDSRRETRIPRPQGPNLGVNSFLAPLPRTPSPGEGPASKWPVEAAGAVDGEPRSSAPKRRPPLLGRRQRTPAPTATTGRASRTQNSRYAPSGSFGRPYTTLPSFRGVPAGDASLG